MKFKDKVALITGSGRGIGRETAIQMAKEGASIVINYLKDKESAESLQKKLQSEGVKTLLVQCDVSDKTQAEDMFDKVMKKFGRIDVLVNNAGFVAPCPPLELSLDQWQKSFRVNLDSAFICSQIAAKIMLKQGSGSMVNVSSIRGLLNNGRPPILDYSASKAAMISLTKTLAKELSPKIRVNAVGPGMTNTDNVKKFPKETIDTFIKAIYLERLIEPEEVAKTICFLASDDASGITGELIMVDGGQSIE